MSAAIAFYDVRYRVNGSEEDWTQIRFPVDADIVLRDVVRGAEYLVQIRSVSAEGRTSDWVDAPVTVPTTNREGALALPAATVARSGIWNEDTQIEFSSTSSSATITLSAGTFVCDGRTITYNGGAVAVPGAPLAEKTFWLYYYDPTLTGGSRPLYATEDYTVAAGSSGNVIVAPLFIEFPDVGGTGGGSGGVGGGGLTPPACVWVESFVEERDLGYIRAGDMRLGMHLRLWNGDWGRVSRTRNVWRAGYRITTARGVVLTCSDTAPIRVPNGRLAARDLRERQELYVHDGEWDGIDTVAAVEFLGVIEVQDCTVERTFFRAGDVAGRMLDHHNRKMWEPPE